MSSRSLGALLGEWFDRHARDLPWRQTRDPYAIWVSEIMLQQTQVRTVIPYWERWMRTLPDIAAVARAKPQTLHKLWEGLGYYTRVRNLQRAAKVICERHGGRFPRHFEDVLALPGIGRYTAGAICSIAFGEPVPILDGNVIRVLSRVFCIGGDPRDKKVNARLWHLAEQLVKRAVQEAGQQGRRQQRNQTHSGVPPASRFNQGLMELGALICSTRTPSCGLCPVATLCQAHRRGCVARFPMKSRRPATTARRFIAFVIESGGKVLVRQRPAGTVNAHLWEFPNVESVNGTINPAAAAQLALRRRPRKVSPFCSIRHTITRYRITLEVFRGTFGSEAASSVAGRGDRWVSSQAALRLPFPSAHKRVLLNWINLLPRRPR